MRNRIHKSPPVNTIEQVQPRSHLRTLFIYSPLQDFQLTIYSVETHTQLLIGSVEGCRLTSFRRKWNLPHSTGSPPLRGAVSYLLRFLPAGSLYALRYEPPPFPKVVHFLLQSKLCFPEGTSGHAQTIKISTNCLVAGGGRMGVVKASVRLPTKQPCLITQQKCTTGKSLQYVKMVAILFIDLLREFWYSNVLLYVDSHFPSFFSFFILPSFAPSSFQ